MVALVLEDGTGLSNANSYVSVDEADDYFSSHPFYAETWDALGDPDKANLLIRATAILDSLIIWNGTVGYTTQGLGWPRLAVTDLEGRVVASNAVPWAVKMATMELAIYTKRTGDVFGASASAGVERLKIDVIELQFSASTATAPVPANALLALRGLGEYALARRVRRVVVG